MITFNGNRNDGRGHVKVTRTAEGTAFEIAIAVLNIIMWGFVAMAWSHLPEQIPTHFDLAGHADGYGGSFIILVTAAAGTVLSAVICACAYHPDKTLNLPVSMNNAAQWALGVRLMRILGVLIAMMFFFIVVAMGCHDTVYGHIAGAAFPMVVVAIVAVAWFYTFRIRRLG